MHHTSSRPVERWIPAVAVVMTMNMGFVIMSTTTGWFLTFTMVMVMAKVVSMIEV